MANAKEARAWARSTLRGIGNSLYTPFCGVDGDDIEWDAYRTLVRYCVAELRHPMLWCTSGIAEFWSLTLDERKRLLEVAIVEGCAANPDVVVQACTAATPPKRARSGRRAAGCCTSSRPTWSSGNAILPSTALAGCVQGSSGLRNSAQPAICTKPRN